MSKASRLERIIREMGSVMVAFSGGADSSLLLKACRDALGARAIAVTAVSETYPREELACARAVARSLHARHLVIRTQELKDRRFASNPPQRCYYCKQELFKRLAGLAARMKVAHVVEASTVSDRADYRPGTRAKCEAGVRSPLAEAGFTKADVRRLSRKWGLKTWDKPSQACLASRVPYGRKLTPALLRKVESAEALVWAKGFSQARVRDHGDTCRIEVPVRELGTALRAREALLAGLKALGYKYVTLDLQGYRTGSLNEVMKDEKNIS